MSAPIAWQPRTVPCTYPACGCPPVLLGEPDDEMGVMEFEPCTILDWSSGRHMAHAGAYEGKPAPSLFPPGWPGPAPLSTEPHST